MIRPYLADEQVLDEIHLIPLIYDFNAFFVVKVNTTFTKLRHGKSDIRNRYKISA